VHPVGISIVTSSGQQYYQLLMEERREKLEKRKQIVKAEGLDVETLLL